MTTVKTRFAPSPTGFMHLGNARTALFNALFAYQNKGTFLLRIEDTDQERSTTAFAEQLMTDLHWLGLDWQEGPQQEGVHSPYYQSQRNDIYAHYYATLQEKGLAYPCFCSPRELELSRKLQRSAGQPPRYTGTCAHLSEAEIKRKLDEGLKPTLRFRMPRDHMIEFDDLVKGKQRFASNDIGDFIIRRADETPAFFFCNAVDDALMGVTHVFRGEDHLTNTPRQQMILEALDLPIPQYGHISIILGSDGTPLSKRNGSLSIQELRDTGWLSEGVVSYLARLGHAYVDDKGDFWSLNTLAEKFMIARLGTAPARFDQQQLEYWQKLAVGQADMADLWQWLPDVTKQLVPDNLQNAFIAAIKANVTFPQESVLWAKMLFAETFEISEAAQKDIDQAGDEFFQHAVQALEDSQADYKSLVNQLKKNSGKKGKALFMPLRAALTGQTQGPEMGKLLPLMGIDKARQRLQTWANNSE